MTEPAHILAACVAALLAAGCLCSALNAPHEGNTQRRILRVTPIYTIAQGAHLDATVEAGTRPPQALALTEASSQDPAIATASVLDPQTVRITGVAEGYTSVSLVATHDGSTLKDALPIHVKAPKSLKLSPCSDVGPALYLAGHDNAVRVRFNPGDPRATLRGRGYYPVKIEPPGAAEVVSELGGEDYLVLRIKPDAPETITLTSALPGDHHAVGLRVVKPDAIKIALLKVDAPDSAIVGQRAEAYIHYSTFDPEHGETPICAMLPYIAEVDQDCRFSAQNALQDAGKSIYGAGVGLAVEALRVGVCKLSVRPGISGVMVMGSMSLITVEAAAPTSTHRRRHSFDFD